MLNLTIDYQKNEKDRIAHISKHIKVDSQSPLFRIEGVNGSGKTLILETIALGFNLEPKQIHDEWLKKFYTDYIKGNYAQKTEFTLESTFSGYYIESKKMPDALIPTVKVDNQLKTSDFIQNNFPIFFDSIKSPEKQSEEYLNDARLFIKTLQNDVEEIYRCLANEKSENNRYADSEQTLKKYSDKKANAESAKQRITEETRNNNLYITRLEYSKLLIEKNILLKRIDELKNKQHQLELLKKDQRAREREKKRASQENNDAKTLFTNAYAALVVDPYWGELDFLAPLPKCEYGELPPYISKIESHISRINESIQKLKGQADYNSVKFYKAFISFINDYFKEFCNRYPQLYDEVTKQYEKLSQIANKENDLLETRKKLLQLKESLEKLYATANDKSDLINEISQSNKYDGINGQLYKIERELTQANELICQKNGEIQKLLENSKSEINALPITDLSQIVKDLDERKSKASTLVNDFDTAVQTIRESTAIIAETQNRKAPRYFNYKEKIEKLTSETGNIISYLEKMDAVIEKLLNHDKNLNAAQTSIANKLGLYFASVQKNILLAPSQSETIIEVAQIDLINNAYILKDGSKAPFQTNTGNILINTLIGKIRSLTPGKKHILLIDEVSPLDWRHLELLENEMLLQIKQGNILFAAIAVPGAKYDDDCPHIVEVTRNV